MERKTEVLPALLCIPDINGYTRLMKEAKVDDSHKIIPVLLENIINSNILNFNVAEIEGDAILFYRIGEAPQMADIWRQCQKIYFDFSQKLRVLKEEYLQYSESAVFPDWLGLKIVVHFGHIGLIQIGESIKPMGQDVIIAHRLLKNSVPEKEYLLLSEQYLAQTVKGDLSDYVELFREEEDEYEHIGVVKYRYINLDMNFELHNLPVR